MGRRSSQNQYPTLTSVAQLVGHHPAKQKAAGSIPSWVHAWVAGSAPRWDVQEATD